MNKKYITTAIPYVNGTPHIGHALDYCLADTLCRYYRLAGDEVKFQVGTDEHGNKIYQKASETGISVKDYVDKNVDVFKKFIKKLDVSYTDFVRTTDESHEKRCQEIWKRLERHIYKARYEGWYCTGCERFVTEKEYEENHGVCPDHQKAYEKLAEDNYYFRISDFKDRIRDAILSNQMLILPEFRKSEILKLIDDSPDVSISRPVSQLTWGVPVPGDDSQVMYVWIDALSNYITVLGYPEKAIDEWWPAAVQIVGKDILRFHAIIWPAMLMGLRLELPKVILSHGMILADGQKMSKSVGNVVDPIEVIDRHGLDAFRYFFLRHVDTFNDSDFTSQKFEDAYNNELANDLGNLVQRLAVLGFKNQVEIKKKASFREIPSEYHEMFRRFELSKAFDFAWERINDINRRIDIEKPWEMAKKGEEERLNQCLSQLISDLLVCNLMISPFLPEAAKKIDAVFDGSITVPVSPLFPKGK